MKQKIKITGKSLRAILMVGVLTIGFSFMSKAQFSYGVRIDAGAACQSDLLELANNCDVRFSPSVGLIGKYNFTEGFALKSGLMYQQKGRNFTEADVDVTNKLDYLTLPLKAEFSAGEKAGFKNGQRFYFAVGPYLSYKLDAEGKLDGVKYDMNTETKDFDAGLGMELGMEFPVFKQKALQVGLNYDMGFVEVYKDTPDLHNKMASISLGLLF
ncbi:porin family protein [uncultured Draconibacterium sp.]|uniref:porin family protein n=1 Tax=uncultured Draconibacterium sp. TaxID=1573823 RepID=UPI002AA80A54|nr:porin family protein [uncultured Draconibacterium sp.]